MHNGGHSLDTSLWTRRGHGSSSMPKLTNSIVDKLPAPAKGNRIYYDGGGFGVRVTAAGARSFVLSYRTREGRERRFTIGRSQDWSVANARAEAVRLRREIDQGADPLGELQEERSAETVADLCERYLTEHGPRLRVRTRADYQNVIKLHILPPIGKLKVKSVTFRDVDRIHRHVTMSGATYQANRVFSLLNGIFKFAIRWKLRADNPCTGIRKNAEHQRQRYLSNEELGRLMAALDAYSDQYVADIFRLLLLTGARRSEVLKMKWDDVNLTDGTWVKPAAITKQKKRHEIPLNAPARLVLAGLLRSRDTSDEYVFPASRGASGPRRTVEKPWRAICRAAKINDLRVHDLRHSFASQLASAGIGLYTIGGLLGHKKASTTQRYAHLTSDALRQASERAGAAIVGDIAAPVVPLKGGRRG
jgi:integrase